MVFSFLYAVQSNNFLKISRKTGSRALHYDFILKNQATRGIGPENTILLSDYCNTPCFHLHHLFHIKKAVTFVTAFYWFPTKKRHHKPGPVLVRARHNNRASNRLFFSDAIDKSFSQPLHGIIRFGKTAQ